MDWIDIAEDQGLDQWLLAHRWIAGIGAALSLLLIGFASGIATMFFANWNFRLTREPRALRRTRGLTTRTDVALPVRRVPAAILVPGWFRRRFGWHGQIGRAAWRERVGQYVWISVVPVALKKKK